MAGYLEKYGEGDERREKITKWTVISILALVVVGGLVYSIFHNYPEEHQAKRFFDLLAARNYQSAYSLWGCTVDHPCRDYPFNAFLKDWGPDVSPVSNVDVLDGESCGSGVIVDVDAGKAGDKKLWVERSTRVLGFPPYDRCPQGNRIHDFWRNLRYRLHGRATPAEGS
jgi:hypothetical protein